MKEVAIGSVVWVYTDERVYEKDERGFSYGAPFWRKSWVPIKITSETTRSWVLANGVKVSKKNSDPLICFSEREIEEKTWIHDNQHLLAERVKRRSLSFAQLKQIAEIVGYKEQSLRPCGLDREANAI